MELLTLDSSFQPENPVENYESLIWTERYSAAGDFELKTNDVEAMMSALPLESCVTLRDSTVPMVVEVYRIEKSLQGAPLLTIIGRSFEAVALERRASVNRVLPYSSTPGPSFWGINAEKESDAAYKAIRTVIGDPQQRYTYADPPVAIAGLPPVNPAVTLEDVIEEVNLVLPRDFDTGESKLYEIKPGVLYNVVLELLAANHRGIKSVRPAHGYSQIGIEIYNGADLTVGDDAPVFDARYDQFANSTYLLSQLGSMNVAYIYGPNGGEIVPKTVGAETLTGMDRRVLLMDQAGDQTSLSPDNRRSRALIELYKYNATAMFDGELAEQIVSGYNVDYFLGDIIKLVGEYGLSQNVRIAEFIRSEDKSGYKAYPGFETVV